MNVSLAYEGRTLLYAIHLIHVFYIYGFIHYGKGTPTKNAQSATNDHAYC